MTDGLGERLKKAFKKAEPKEGEKVTPEKKEATTPPTVTLPVKVDHTIPVEEANKAREDLRILNLEKEIVSYALTRLYEAEAEGKITKDERIQLVNKYKDEMRSLDTEIDRKQMMVKLHELEGAQADLVKMFHDKFGEISKNIDDIRTTLGVVTREKPKGEPHPPEQIPTVPKEKKVEEKALPKVKAPPKSKAEEKIEAIQEEVLKVLERLEQMETEA